MNSDKCRNMVAVSLCFAALLSFAETAAPAQIALLTRLEQTNRWTSDQGAKSVPVTNIPLLSSPSLSTDDRKLVRWCLARYGLYGVPAGEEEAENSAEQAARRYFDAMPRAEIARKLVPIRKALYRGTRAYTSVAFVLAYYDIDFECNAQRIVESISLTGKPPAKLKAEGFKSEGEDPSGAEAVADAVETLYRRHHSATMLRGYLRAPVDAHLGEDWGGTLASLFLAYPADVLRAASNQQDMKRLADGVHFGVNGPDAGVDDNSKLRRVLRRLEYSNGPQTARLVNRFRRAFATQSD